MITEEEYLKAKKIVQEYESKHLNISDVRVSVCEHPKPWKNTPWGYKVCPECNDIVEWEQTAP